MITREEVLENFKVSGLDVELTYEKYKTSTLTPVRLFVTNSSEQFDIQFYPTASSAVSFTTTSSLVINQQSPYFLSRSVSSNLSTAEILVNINTSNYNNLSNNTERSFDIKFNIVGVTESITARVTNLNSTGGGEASQTQGSGPGSTDGDDRELI